MKEEISGLCLMIIIGHEDRNDEFGIHSDMQLSLLYFLMSVFLLLGKKIICSLSFLLLFLIPGWIFIPLNEWLTPVGTRPSYPELGIMGEGRGSNGRHQCWTRCKKWWKENVHMVMEDVASPQHSSGSNDVYLWMYIILVQCGYTSLVICWVSGFGVCRCMEAVLCKGKEETECSIA